MSDWSKFESANPELMQALGGMRVLEVDRQAGSALLAFECLPAFCHSGGSTAQGGFVTAWLDAAMAHAVILTADEPVNVASLDINVRFLERVAPGPVHALGRIVRRGRRVVFLEARLMRPDGSLLASASSSGMLVPGPPPSGSH
ncbi:MAG: hotdog domain-containing protein [Burkholderiaceae bacterium]